MAKTITSHYDVAEHLRTPEEMAAYLEACLDEADGDAGFICQGFGRYRTRLKVCRESPATLACRAKVFIRLCPENEPAGFDTILKVIRALGLKLHAEATGQVRRLHFNPTATRAVWRFSFNVYTWYNPATVFPAGDSALVLGLTFLQGFLMEMFLGPPRFSGCSFGPRLCLRSKSTPASSGEAAGGLPDLVPLLLMLPVFVITGIALAEASNLWPIILIFAAPFGTASLVILFVIRGFVAEGQRWRSRSAASPNKARQLTRQPHHRFGSF